MGTFVVSKTLHFLIFACAMGIASHGFAASGSNSEVYKKTYAQMIDAGKSSFQAKVYAEGFTEAKQSGLTDIRARKFAEAYLSAYTAARDQGRKCPRDCEAYASDFAGQVIRAK